MANAMSNRLWLNTNYTDGWRIRLNMEHFGDKISLHKWISRLAA